MTAKHSLTHLRRNAVSNERALIIRIDTSLNYTITPRMLLTNTWANLLSDPVQSARTIYDQPHNTEHDIALFSKLRLITDQLDYYPGYEYLITNYTTKLYDPTLRYCKLHIYTINAERTGLL